MMDSITEFAKSSDGTLENIQFVIYDDKMLEDFKAVVKAYKSAKPKQTSMLGGIWKAFKGKLHVLEYIYVICLTKFYVSHCICLRRK